MILSKRFFASILFICLALLASASVLAQALRLQRGDALPQVCYPQRDFFQKFNGSTYDLYYCREYKTDGTGWRQLFVSPLTTAGDLLTYDTAPGRQGIGTDGQVL